MNKKLGKIIVCYPIVTGNGNKYIATNIAHNIKKMYEKSKVALVDFDVKNPYLAGKLAMHDDIHGIDNLLDKIDGKFLSNELFMENMITLKNQVDLLKGTKLLGHHYIITKEHITEMIKHLRELYDYIVIAVSNGADNSATVFSLSKADKIVITVRHTFANKDSIEGELELIKTYKNKNIPIYSIYNMLNDTSEPYNFLEIFKKNNVEVIGAIGYNPETIDNSDIENKNIPIKVFRKNNRKEDIYEEIIEKLIFKN